MIVSAKSGEAKPVDALFGFMRMRRRIATIRSQGWNGDRKQDCGC